MNYRIWLINIFLAALLVVSGFRIMHMWEAEPQAIADMPAQRKDRETTASFEEKQALFEERAYELLVRQNLFAPDRKEYAPETGDEQQPESIGPKVSGETVVLYGVVITEGRKTALINNPGGRLGDGKFLWVEEGQAISNLKVTAIHPEEIVLEDSGKQYQILLSEKKQRPSPGQAGQSSGPTVVSSGSSQQKVRSQSVSSSSGLSQQTGGSSSGTAKKTRTSSDSGSEEKYKLVDTPFGTRKVKVE